MVWLFLSDWGWMLKKWLSVRHTCFFTCFFISQHFVDLFEAMNQSSLWTRLTKSLAPEQESLHADQVRSVWRLSREGEKFLPGNGGFLIFLPGFARWNFVTFENQVWSRGIPSNISQEHPVKKAWKGGYFLIPTNTPYLVWKTLVQAESYGSLPKETKAFDVRWQRPGVLEAFLTLQVFCGDLQRSGSIFLWKLLEKLAVTSSHAVGQALF